MWWRLPSDGHVFLNTDPVKPEDLAPKVKDLLTGRTDKTVFVKSDQRAKYQVVLDVVQNLQAAGVDQLGLLTEQQQDRRRPATGAAGGPPAEAEVTGSIQKEQFYVNGSRRRRWC